MPVMRQWEKRPRDDLALLVYPLLGQRQGWRHWVATLYLLIR
jgi:hypothetical protein